MDVQITQVTAGGRAVLSNLVQLYIHDLSATFEVDIEPDGRFAYPKLDAYFAAPDGHHAYFLRADGGLAGFALVTRGSPALADPDVFDVAEFFVLRRHRRTGVGRRAAHLLWRTQPGRWVVRVAEASTGARTFWQETIDAFVGAHVAPGAWAGARQPFHCYVFDVPTPTAAA
jgi:predicted acetyltransferase